jgi:hypothetical protein
LTGRKEGKSMKGRKEGKMGRKAVGEGRKAGTWRPTEGKEGEWR